MILAQIVVALVGLYVIGRTVLSAVRTFVVPRGDNDPLSRLAFRVISPAFKLVAPRLAPVRVPRPDHGLLRPDRPGRCSRPGGWSCSCIGFAAIYWVLG